jgi:transposase
LGQTELSSKELSRAEVMGRVKAGDRRVREASELLDVSYRQGKRIWARYRRGGAEALQHGNCRRRSNRAYAEEFRQAVFRQVRVRYGDFGPTLAAEHLASDHGLKVHAETALDERGGTMLLRNRLPRTAGHTRGCLRAT